MHDLWEVDILWKGDTKTVILTSEDYIPFIPEDLMTDVDWSKELLRPITEIRKHYYLEDLDLQEIKALSRNLYYTIINAEKIVEAEDTPEDRRIRTMKRLEDYRELGRAIFKMTEKEENVSTSTSDI